MVKIDKWQIEKNKLDLDYQKYLQYQNTVVIIVATLSIGILIAFITDAPINWQLLIMVSIIAYSILFVLWLSFGGRIKERLDEIDSLNVKHKMK